MNRGEIELQFFLYKNCDCDLQCVKKACLFGLHNFAQNVVVIYKYD